VTDVHNLPAYNVHSTSILTRASTLVYCTLCRPHESQQRRARGWATNSDNNYNTNGYNNGAATNAATDLVFSAAGGGGVDDVLQQSQHHQQQLDEYVPTAVMDTLLRVLQDPLLTGHYQVHLETISAKICRAKELTCPLST
jgi:hypothetical protein